MQAKTNTGTCYGLFRHQNGSGDRRFVQLTMIQIFAILRMDILFKPILFINTSRRQYGTEPRVLDTVVLGPISDQ